MGKIKYRIYLYFIKVCFFNFYNLSLIIYSFCCFVCVIGGVEVMSKDISTIYTRYKNLKCGRKGYCAFDREKVTVIKPKDYGMFLQKDRKVR